MATLRVGTVAAPTALSKMALTVSPLAVHASPNVATASGCWVRLATMATT